MLPLYEACSNLVSDTGLREYTGIVKQHRKLLLSTRRWLENAVWNNITGYSNIEKRTSRV